LDGREVTAGSGPAYGEGPPPETEEAAEREPRDLGSLVDELRAAVGAEHVFTHEHQLRTYESDGLLQYAVTPGAVVLPDSTGEVMAVVRACHRAGVPFVARGAGSGRAAG
jgi:FAD binding domain